MPQVKLSTTCTESLIALRCDGFSQTMTTFETDITIVLKSLPCASSSREWVAPQACSRVVLHFDIYTIALFL
jgi:hypothetical protein